MKPLVSILIPCRNGEAFVTEAVESALAQDYPHVEVVVIDDGSTDRSVEKIRAFGNRVLFESGPQRGACAARNRALRLSRGEFIQFLDADDLLMPSKVSRQMPLLLSGAADLVFCRGYLFGDGKPARPKKRMIPSPENQDPFLYCLSSGLSTEGPIHRRSCLERVGGFRDHLPRAQELDLHLRLAATNVRIHLLDDLLYQHRDHDGPRITKWEQPADYMVKFLVGLADVLESGEPYVMTPARRQALAKALMEQSVAAFRKEAEQAAADGFARAERLHGRVSHPGRAWQRLLGQVVGPLAVENVLKAGRAGRRLLFGVGT